MIAVAACLLAVVAADPPPPPHWVYTHHKGGPSDDAAQKATWGVWGATCPIGRLQSPIDIVTEEAAVSERLLGAIEPSFAPFPLVCNNSGHAFQAGLVKGAKDAVTVLRGEEFKFVQVHFHTPAEHTIDGKRAIMEGHFVHSSTDPSTAPGLAVLGIFFELQDECNPVLAKFWHFFPTDGTVGQGPKLAGEVDFMELLTPALAGGYYHYTGSLTTPPCTEGVDWNLAKGFLGVCQAQIDRLKEGIASVQEGVDINNRYIQELHQRDVTTTPPQAIPSLLVHDGLAAPPRKPVAHLRMNGVMLTALVLAVFAVGSLLISKRGLRAGGLLDAGIKIVHADGEEVDHEYVPWYVRGAAA